MREGRLEEIRVEVNSDLYPREAEYALELGKELLAEVEMLRGRLQAVCDVLADADAFDGVVHQEKVMDAVRGYRQATMDEAKAKLSGSAVDDDVLLKWIIDWKITVHADGKLVIDDLTGLAYAMMGGSAWRLN